MTDRFDPNRADAPKAPQTDGESEQWTPVQAGDGRRVDSADGPAANTTQQPVPDDMNGQAQQPQQPFQQQPQQPQQQSQQQPQSMYWSQFAAQQMNMDPDFLKLRTIRSQITAANIMGPVSLIIGGMPLSIAGIVCAVLAYRGAKKVGEGNSQSAAFAQNFMRSARVSIIICCIAFVLNAISFAMFLPTLMEIVNGDMSAVMDMSGLDAGGSTSDGGSGDSAWG